MYPKESFCGVCEDCGLGSGELRRLAYRLLQILDTFQLRMYSGRVESEVFDYPAVIKGLGFLVEAECPGCKAGGCVESCPIRDCAISRSFQDCSRCHELEECAKLRFVTEEFPEIKKRLMKARLRYLASTYHSRLMEEK